MGHDSFEEDKPDSFQADSFEPIETAPLHVARPSAPVESDPLPSDSKEVFSKAGSAAVGAGDGLTQGWGDELQGYAGAKIRQALRDFGITKPDSAVAAPGQSGPLTVTKTRVSPKGQRTVISSKTTVPTALSSDEPVEPTFADDYRGERDASRRMSRIAQDEHGGAYFGGNLGGDLLGQAALAGITEGSSVTPGGQALIGGLSGLGNSDADLTKGGARDFGKAALSAGTGATLGFLTGKAGQKLGGILNNGAAKAGANSLTASADAAQMANRVAQKNLQSGVGALGGASSGAERTMEVLQKVAQGEMGATPEMIAEAKSLLASDKGAELMRGVAASHLERAPSQLGKVATAKEVLGPLQAAAAPEAVDAAADEMLANPIRKHVLPKFAKYALKAGIPAIGATIGGALGGPGWAEMGALGGGLLASGMGKPGTALANTLKQPGFRKLAWDVTEGALKAGGVSVDALGKYGPVLAREAQRGGMDAAKVLDYVLMEKDPEYAAKKAELVQASSSGGGGGL